jgi:hypothetical protein
MSEKLSENTPSREMTLREWTMRLPEEHLARKELAALESSLAQAQAVVEALRTELEGLRAWKRSIDEALNSGDGAYRP